MKCKKNFIISIIIILVSISGIIASFYYEDYTYEREFGNYISIDHEIPVNSRIKSIIRNRGAYITLEDNMLCVFPPAANYKYMPPFLDDFIKEGDSLIKNKNCDTLFLYRNNEKYLFILYQRINKENIHK